MRRFGRSRGRRRQFALAPQLTLVRAGSCASGLSPRARRRRHGTRRRGGLARRHRMRRRLRRRRCRQPGAAARPAGPSPAAPAPPERPALPRPAASAPAHRHRVDPARGARTAAQPPGAAARGAGRGPSPAFGLSGTTGNRAAAFARPSADAPSRAACRRRRRCDRRRHARRELRGLVGDRARTCGRLRNRAAAGADRLAPRHHRVGTNVTACGYLRFAKSRRSASPLLLLTSS